MSFTFTSIPSLVRPLTFDSDCESFFGQLPAYQINIEELAAQCEANATTLLSMEDIRSSIGNGNIFFASGSGIGFQGGDGGWIWADSSGIRITPGADAHPPAVLNHAGTETLLVLKPATFAAALAGTSTNEPITPASLANVLDNVVLSGSKTWDPPSCFPGETQSTTLTVTGASVGDMVIPHFGILYGQESVMIFAHCFVNNTITVTIRNTSFNSVDLIAGILTVKVLK